MVEAPNGIKFIDIKEIRDLATNLDPVDQPTQYALKLRGGRLGETEAGYMFRRDFGTKMRMSTYPAGALYDSPKESFFDPINGTNHDILVALDVDTGKPTFTRVYVDTSTDATGTWKEVAVKYTAKVNGTPGAADTFITVDNVKDIRGNAIVGFDVTSLVGCVIVNTTAGYETVYCLTRVDADTINVDHQIGSSGLNWADNDDLTIYFDNSLQFTYDNGDTPHIRFKSVEAQRKTTMFYGDSSAVPVGRYPFQLYRRAERKYFYTGAGTALFTLPDGWYAGQGGSGLCPYFVNLKGTLTDPFDVSAGPATTSVAIHDIDSNYPWLGVTLAYNDGTLYSTGKVINLNIMVTLLYANYQESDPICAAYLVVDENKILTTLTFDIDFSLMNKEIVGILVYGAQFDFDTTLSSSARALLRKAVGPDDYILYKTIKFDEYDTATPATTPSLVGTQKYNVTMAFSLDVGGTIPEDPTSTLLGSLNHAPSEHRSIWKPLYGVRALRQQGAIDVIMKDQATLLFSNFSGAGNFEDDNYPDVRTSADDNLQKIFLSGHGDAMGMTIDFNKVIVFRRSEMEVIDIYDTGTRSVLAPRGQNILALDCVAKKSIIVTDRGTYWAGTGYIYLLPKEGGFPKEINSLWKNWYDGTLKNGAGVQYMTDTEKANIIAGYDPTFKEVWFQMYAKKDDNTGYEYVIWRYSETTGKWNQRVLGNATKAVAFSQRSDNTMSILTSSSLLKYPNMIGAGRYKDHVSTTDTGGYGVESYLMMNIGGINHIVRDTVFWGMIFDHYGVSSGTEKLYVKFYANRETSAFHTDPYRVLIGEKMDYALLAEPIGEIFALRVEIYIASSDIDAVTEFDLYGMRLGFLPKAQIGI